MNVRSFQDADYYEVSTWALAHYLRAIERDQIPETTFVAEMDGKLVAVLSVILTNCKRWCLLENLLSNPNAKTRQVKAGTTALLTYVQHFAKALEYKGLFCLAPTESLMRRYKQSGFTATLEGVTTMIKEI